MLENLLSNVSKSLGLGEPIGVIKSKHVQRFVLEFGAFAGVLFDHDAVFV